MKKYLLFAIALLTSIVSFAQVTGTETFPQVAGLGNDSYVITVDKAGQLKALLSDETEIGLRSATKLKIVCVGDAQLSSNNYDDPSKDLHELIHLSTLRTLDLSEAKVQNIDATGSDDYKNPIQQFNNGIITKLILPVQDGMVVKQFSNSSLVSLTIPDYPTGMSYTLGSSLLEGAHSLEEVYIGYGTTTVPASSFTECFNLKNVLMNNDITEIGTNAFADCTSIKYLILPDALTTLGTAAFDKCLNIKTITIPAGMTTWGQNCFDKMYSLTDVYVLGENTPLPLNVFNQAQTTKFYFTGDTQHPSFSSADYLSDHGYDVYDGDNPDLSGNSYTFSLAVLHYPAAATEKYRISSTVLSYSMVDPRTGTTWPDEVDINGGNRGPGQKNKSVDGTNYTFYSALNDQKSWVITPNENGNGYVNQEGFWKIKDKPEVKNSPYVGWKYFLEGNQIEKEQDVWPEERILESRWYSVCYPFDLTLTQFKNAFGIDAALSKLETVDYDEENHWLTLNFTKKVNKTGVAEDAVYMHAHTPYMIHPSRRYENRFSIVDIRSDLFVKVKQEGETDEQFNARREAVYEAAAQLLETNKTVYTGCVDGNTYTFIGNYDEDAFIPKGAYYLGYDPSNPTTWPLGFYKMTKENLAPWTPTCALVTASESTNSSKFMDVNFDELIEEAISGVATSIDGPSVKIDVITENDKVYNMNGQLVRNSAKDLHTLPSGLYIVNGKKINIK
ncbi:MAG: leucine-rich repeat domain-containing protein [Prevotella sp.]|nr:leucine-rich repeat domain-containing protein [Prevotella sp.]